MSIYRVLTKEELNLLNDEFVKFLVLNGITAEDWVKIKEENNQSAEKVIESFSDVVFEKILRQTKYLERFTTQQYATIACIGNNFHMIAIKCKDDTYDLSDKNDIQKALNVLPEAIELYHSQRTVEEKREKEIYNLMQEGFIKSDGTTYLKLIDYLSMSSN